MQCALGLTRQRGDWRSTGAAKQCTFLVAAALGLVATQPTLAQTGNCDPAEAEAYLDGNLVRARVFNNGPLFWRGSPHVYSVYPDTSVSAVFAQNFWIGGLVGGEKRIAAARYGQFEFWPGPLDDNGAPPADCSVFDRIYKISRSDVVAFEATGEKAADLAEWPTGLGAPTLDAAGEPIDLVDQPLASRVGRVIDLDAGERPDFMGDQMLWWVMNDRGNVHQETETEPLGVEVHGTAFSFNLEGPASMTTFYRYRILYRGSERLDSAYVSVFQDGDLGNFDDDYVGSDTTLGMAFLYNSDNEDEGRDGYGTAPPAVGLDFVRGPAVPAPGQTARIGRRVVDEHRNLPMTSFVYTWRDPYQAEMYYNNMRGRLADGSPITVGGRGQDSESGGDETLFSYPGDPVTGAFWSERNTDGQGRANPPADRWYMASSGPFSMEPGDEQEFIIAIVYARGSSNLDSITELRRADRAIQAFFDDDFGIAPNMPAPRVALTPYNGAVTLSWTPPDSSGALDKYTQLVPYLGGVFRFEGYNIYQYASPSDSTGERIATYDVSNDVTTVIDGPPGGEALLVAWGSDSGIQHFHTVTELTNHRTYCFGVEAYAYQSGYHPRVVRSRVERVCGEPYQPQANAAGPLLIPADADTLVATPVVGAVAGAVAVATIVNPAVLTGQAYTVTFHESSCAADYTTARERLCITFDLTREDGTQLLVDAEPDGVAGGPPQFQFDGLTWTVSAPSPGFENFVVVQNADGAVDPPDFAAFAFNGWGFPHPGLGDRPTSRQQSNGSTWGIHAGLGSEGPYGPVSDPESFLGRVTRNGDNLDEIGRDDYEIRFTADGGLAYRRFSDGATFPVPFELWNIGTTPDDASDDVRLIPAICEWTCLGGTLQAYEETGREELVFDIGDDHRASGGVNDPYTDLLFWGLPSDASPGQAGYEAFFAGSGEWAHEVFADMILMNWNGGEFPGPYDASMPEEGTVFRIVTNKYPTDGESLSLSTAGLAPTALSVDERRERLDTIGIVPNPFYAFSDYQVSPEAFEARFTNVPAGATVRVFTLSGSLVASLRQDAEGILPWDLTNQAGKSLANGMYLIHVEVPDVGERILKFAIVKANPVTGS